MKIYEVLMRVEAEDGMEPERVSREFYDACENVPFGFDIINVTRGVQSMSLKDVDGLAERAHAGQVDKIGVPYIGHVRAVAAGLAPFGEIAQMAGLLHDVLEDTKWTVEGLLGVGVPKPVVDIVQIVTKTPGVAYLGKLKTIVTSGNEVAVLVKIADNAHNSRSDRAQFLSTEQRTRLKSKYAAAREILWPAATRKDVEAIIEIVNPDLF
jgi:(p)ppGpp synthase/HD superfamily hydrolase